MKGILLAPVLLAVTMGSTAGGEGDREWRIEAAVLGAIYGREPTREQITTALKWQRCVNHAVDIYAPEPEAAATVADAAITSCSAEMVQYMTTFGIKYQESMREATRPELIARTMAIRAGSKSAAPNQSRVGDK